jgi:hypothetical protein
MEVEFEDAVVYFKTKFAIIRPFGRRRRSWNSLSMSKF